MLGLLQWLSGQPDRYIFEIGQASGFVVLSKPIDEGLLFEVLKRRLLA